MGWEGEVMKVKKCDEIAQETHMGPGDKSMWSGSCIEDKTKGVERKRGSTTEVT